MYVNLFYPTALTPPPMLPPVVDNKLQGQAAVWRLPAEEEDVDIHDVGLHDASSSNAKNLELLSRLDNSDYGNFIRLVCLYNISLFKQI